MHAPPPRPAWPTLPPALRRAVEHVLDGAVVAARSQTGGFSPGSADRVRTASGRRAFVKAVDGGAYPSSADLHRQEAAINAVLPAEAPVPRLLAVIDEREWVALVLDEVEGREPLLPWRTEDLFAAFDALEMLGALLTPAPPGVPDLAESLRPALLGWARLRQDDAPLPEAWMRGPLDRLVELSEAAAVAVCGNSVQHGDVRSDNFLITPDGRAVLIDWPAAGAGADWFDSFCLVANARVFDPSLDADGLIAARPGLARVAPDEITAVLAGLVGYFLDGARLPPPPGLPTVRSFQALQGRELGLWLRHRLGA